MDARWLDRCRRCLVPSIVVVSCLASIMSSPMSAHAQTILPLDEAPAADATQPRRAESMETPRTLALGTGARASSSSTAALAHSPGGLGLSKLYHIEGLVGYVPGVARWVLGANIVDSTTSDLAAGLSFRGILGASDEGYSGFDARLALAYPLANMIGIGLAGRYLSLTSDGQVAEGADDTLVAGFTLDASLVFAPIEGLRLAGLAYNFINLDSSLAPIQLGGSASFTFAEIVSIGADVLADLTTNEEPSLVAGGGVEVLIAGKVPLRAGYAFDGARSIHTLTGGVGYVEQRFGVEVSLRQDVSGASDTSLLASVRYFVQ